MKNTRFASVVDHAALEQAAKYICTSKCGLCPMVTEGFRCPQKCDLDTKAWQCWISYFLEKSMKMKSF